MFEPSCEQPEMEARVAAKMQQLALTSSVGARGREAREEGRG